MDIYHAIGAAKIGLFVPEHLDIRTEQVARHVNSIVIAVRAGKNDDAEFHATQV